MTYANANDSLCSILKEEGYAMVGYLFIFCIIYLSEREKEGEEKEMKLNEYFVCVWEC